VTRTVLALAASLVAVGCGSSATEVCDAISECENSNEKDYDKCLVENEAAEETAEVYGCTAEYEDLRECFLAKARCRDGELSAEDECQPEVEDLDRCRADGSTLD
jgi:hypothetical protein